jgi:hypothetical protein
MCLNQSVAIRESSIRDLLPKWEIRSGKEGLLCLHMKAGRLRLPTNHGSLRRYKTSGRLDLSGRSAR